MIKGSLNKVNKAVEFYWRERERYGGKAKQRRHLSIETSD